MTCKELCELLKSLKGTESWEQPVYVNGVFGNGIQLKTFELLANHPDFPISRGSSPHPMGLCNIPWGRDVKFNKDWDKEEA